MSKNLERITKMLESEDVQRGNRNAGMACALMMTFSRILDQKDAELQAVLDQLSKNVVDGTTAAMVQVVKEQTDEMAIIKEILVGALKRLDEVEERLKRKSTPRRGPIKFA